VNSTNILWIIVAVAVICLLSWLFYSAKGDAVRLLSMIVLAIILVISLFYLSFAAFYLVTDWNGDISKEIRSVGTFTLGLPVAARGSLALIIVLPAATNQKKKFYL
jgi:apolipoprotein N-acyltransferase